MRLGVHFEQATSPLVGATQLFSGRRLLVDLIVIVLSLRRLLRVVWDNGSRQVRGTCTTRISLGLTQLVISLFAIVQALLHLDLGQLRPTILTVTSRCGVNCSVAFPCSRAFS